LIFDNEGLLILVNHLANALRNREVIANAVMSHNLKKDAKTAGYLGSGFGLLRFRNAVFAGNRTDRAG
jgi:hypothetical protein